jgi:DNA-binding MurR/RpiR family transcriptional regulator
LSILKRINAKLDTMAPSDRQIGSFIVDNPDQMLRLSSAALAEATGRSQSSVVKFSQKLGFAGYQELKLAVSEAKAQEWRMPEGMVHGSIERADGLGTVLGKLVGSKMSAINQTVAANSERNILAAVAALDRARRIDLAGVSSSSLVARDFCLKLMKLGRNAQHDPDAHVQLANASNLGKADVLMALSHSGQSIETLRIAELAHSRGATIVAVTGLHDNPIARMADINLYTIAEDERARSSAITVRDAQQTLTDLLFILTMQRQEDAHEYIQRSDAAMRPLKVGTN